MRVADSVMWKATVGMDLSVKVYVGLAVDIQASSHWYGHD